MADRTGTAGDDVLRGTPGRDLLRGLDGRDVLTGRAGRDRLDGGAGDDSVDGGAGDDTLVGGAGRDTIVGGSGVDILTFDAFDGGVMLLGTSIVAQRFAAGIPFAGTEVYGKAITGVELLVASRGNDRISVDASDGFLALGGGPGRDHLVSFSDSAVYGGADDDIIEASGAPVGEGPARAWGGAGDDIILADIARGGAGNDTLAATFVDARMTGGAGADTFVIYGPQPLSEPRFAHVITDFSAAEGDRVVFMENLGAFGFPFVNFAAMLANTEDTRAGAVIRWRDSSLLLAGVERDSLDAAAFGFEPARDLF